MKRAIEVGKRGGAITAGRKDTSRLIVGREYETKKVKKVKV
jgi:hypothetical protein